MKNILISKSLDEMKKFFCAEHIRTPLTVSFDITRSCNMHCMHCYNKRSPLPDYLDSYDKVYSVVKKLCDLQVYEVTISGGEPLVSPFFLDFVAEVKRQGMCTRIITNGILIDKYYKRLSEILTKNDTIQYSIDEALHTRNRQRYLTMHEKQICYHNLRKLSAVFKNVIVNITPTKFNQYEIFDIVKDAVDFGARYISATPYIPMGGSAADSAIPDYGLLLDVESRVSTFCAERHIIYFGGISGHACQQKCDSSAQDIKKDAIETIEKERGCDAGNFNFHISNDGRIYPCVFMQFDDFVISEIDKASDSILHDFNNFSDLLNISLPNKCIFCSRLNDCHGGCIGLIYDRYGSLDFSDPRCFS